MICEEVLKHVRVKVCLDPNPFNPREEWDNLGTMVCFHRRYQLGDKQGGTYGFNSPAEVQEFLKEKNCTWKPVYLYDHSGLTVSTTPGQFAAIDPQGFDWGQVGVIFVTPEKIAKEYGSDTPENRKTARQVLEGEIEDYDKFLRGEAYGFVVEYEDGKVIESCWGFYDIDEAMNEGRAIAQQIVEEESNPIRTTLSNGKTIEIL